MPSLFDGFSRYVDCGAADRGIVGNITIEAWIKTTSSAGQFAVTKYSNSLFSESGFEFGTNQGKAVIYGRAGVGQYLSSGLSTTFVNDGRWHHIVGQVEQNVWRIFVDGVLENSTAYSYSGGDLRTPEAMTIGTYTYLNNFYFQGEIDEVRVWRTARSAADIQANMCRKYATAPTDLVAYYNFDQSSGLAAADKGSQPTTGSLVSFSGTPWHLSGAPLGDASTSLYASTWAAGSKVALATSTTDSAVVSGLPTQTRGVQLYTVNSAPTIAAGTGAASNYIGVFTAGTASTLAYQLRLRPATGPSCRSLQQRSANDQNWANLAPTSTTATSLIANNLTYRGEYILLGNVSAAIAVAGDSAVCAGATGQLTATATGATSYLWSTGATTPVLSGVGPGTYTVTVGFAGGCSGTGQGTIRLARAPVPTISGDSVVCAGAYGPPHGHRHGLRCLPLEYGGHHGQHYGRAGRHLHRNGYFGRGLRPHGYLSGTGTDTDPHHGSRRTRQCARGLRAASRPPRPGPPPIAGIPGPRHRYSAAWGRARTRSRLLSRAGARLPPRVLSGWPGPPCRLSVATRRCARGPRAGSRPPRPGPPPTAGIPGLLRPC